MQRLGINTIEGWFEKQFDTTTLDAAARNGIGVLMPFELNQDVDYSDPAIRQHGCRTLCPSGQHSGPDVRF